jgi:MFS family permease
MSKRQTAPTDKRVTAHKPSAIQFVVLLGIVSLFADMTYEGARSITGPYLAFLGASAAATGVVAGFGEFIGYGLRLISGYLSDRTGRYWAVTLWGYALNLVAVPFLALTASWEVAALLIVAERMGKALRTPARDAMLSHATTQMGRGWGFGLHEAMDQIGAVLGPLLVALVLSLRGGYSGGFAILVLPAALALGTLVVARRLYPQPQDLEVLGGQPVATLGQQLPRLYWLYLSFVAVGVAGYANFQLVSYHFQTSSLVSETQIPVLFAIAMGVDALVALIVGRLFDRVGLSLLALIPLLSLPIAPLAFSLSYEAAVAGVVLWGAAMGIQETVMRAAIAGMVPLARRGTAYGIFNAAYGLSWFLGAACMGVLYEVGIGYLIAFSVGLELASFPLLLLVRSAARANEATR